MGIAVIAAIKSTFTKRNLGDWIALVVSFVWFVIGFIYFDRWWMLYGD
jgi:hypothetical protein